MGKPRVRSIENQYTAAHERKEHNKKSHKKRLARRLTAFFIMAAVVSGVLISSMVTQASVLETKQNEKTQLEQKIVELDQQEVDRPVDVGGCCGHVFSWSDGWSDWARWSALGDVSPVHGGRPDDEPPRP